MKLQFLQLSVLCGFQLLSPALSHPSKGPSKLPLPSKLVHQFPLPTWIENVSPRSNGNLLLTILSTPDLYTINPLSSSPTPKLLHTFPGITGLLGIAEVFPDVFVLVGGNFSLTTTTATPSTYSAWTVDFTKYPSPKISKIVDLKEAYFLNGLTLLPSLPGNVLIADSTLGLVWRLNVSTKKYERIISNIPEMAPVGSPSLGINGLRVYKGYLYWTNTNKASLYRARITSSGKLVPNTPVELLAVDAIAMDDFSIDEKTGIAYVCSNFENTVLAVKDGKVKTVLGSLGELTVAGDTASAFGRAKKDKDVLYVVTGGALGSPVNGTITEGGKIVAVDTKGFRF